MANNTTPSKEVPIEERIREVTKRVMEAMLENALAAKAETDAKINKERAHYRVQQATQELNDLRKELMEIRIN